MSESSKYRHLVLQYLTGAGVDIGSQGAAVVPWAISFDLPEPERSHYAGGQAAYGPIHLRGDCRKLPFDSNSLDFAYSSHVIEDFRLAEWPDLVSEWVRVIKPGGYLILLAPEKELWADYVRKGGCPNCAHRHEPTFGEFSALGAQLGLNLVLEKMTNCYPGDYTILAVFTKPLKEN